MAVIWEPLTNAPPALPNGETFKADAMLLLPDGSVLVHHAGADLRGGAEWLRLSPSPTGSYRDGTWTPVGAMNSTRQFFASGVRADGSAFVIGGEYSNAAPNGDTPLGEIFDPVTSQWSPIDTKSADFDWIRGDAPCCVLADGRVLLGALTEAKSAIYDPVNGTWTEAGTARNTIASTKEAQAGEETWTLLRDGTVLAVETYATQQRPQGAEKYLPCKDIWVPAGETPAPLVYPVMHEIGPDMLLPDGRVLAIGGTGHIAFYSADPLDPAKPGSWKEGRDVKDDNGTLLTVNDGPACLLPGGKVLCVAGTRTAEPGEDGNPEYWSLGPVFFEYDPEADTVAKLSSQLTLPSTWMIKLLLAPSGEVLCTAEQDQMYVYRSEEPPRDAWRPTISDAPTALVSGVAYPLAGTQLNGLSHAVSYGDDYTAATNYPLVRLEARGTGTPAAYYCTTSKFGYGIATGSERLTIDFTVPGRAPPGDYDLYVVANAIASKPWRVTVSATLVG